MVNWDADISEYFKMPEEDRTEVVLAIAAKYYDHFIDLENVNTYRHTMGALLNTLESRHQRAIREEDYERADILFQLIRIFINIKDNTIG